MEETHKLVISFSDNTEELVPLTDEEKQFLLERKLKNDALAAEIAEQEAVASAKAATKSAALARLGLTEEEINAFLA